MTADMIVFIVIALISLGAAVMVVTTRNIFHAVLWMILVFFGIAGLYVLLNAGFFAVAQVIIYIGAIAVLFIFAIMLTRQDTMRLERPFNEDWLMALILVVVFLGGMVWMFSQWRASVTVTGVGAYELEQADMISKLGSALVDTNGYLIPFEVASVLLIAALIGAVYVAWGRTWQRKKEEK